MKKTISFLLFLLCLTSCIKSNSNKNTTSSEVSKSEIQKLMENYMNSKGSFVKNVAKMQAEFPKDVFEISLIDWNDSPIDTIYKRDIYELKIQELESEMSSYEGVEATLRREIRDKDPEEISNNNQDCEVLKAQYNALMTADDRNEPYFYVYAFKEQLKRTFTVSGGTDVKTYICYGYVAACSKSVYTIEEYAKEPYKRSYEIMYYSIKW